MCPICGCIEDENRPNQETFECIECGHKDNADFNAAKNISNRVLVAVLRESLLKQLDNGFGKCYVKDKDNEDINYNRKVKFLGLSSLKQEVEHIARKYDIAVSTVQASYTSKMCPMCGCIEDENRSSQEIFECIECGYKDNADFNAAKNIRNRVLVTVLRETLLKHLDNGAFEPRKLKCERVKEVLLSFRRNLQDNARSECTESGHTTFDYV